MGGSADEADRAALQVREEGVLLGFVEAVDLVDKENGGLITKLGKGAGRFDFPANFCNI